MKCLRYLAILLFGLFTKVVGVPVFYMVLPFRHWARNRVYNYIIQNDIYSEDMKASNPVLLGDRYILRPTRRPVDAQGYVMYKKVSWIEFQLAFWLVWIWVDDGSNHDTVDERFTGYWATGEQKTWLPEFVRKQIQREYDSFKQFGSAWELGDARVSEVYLVSTLLWIMRNTAYNLNYYFEYGNPDADYVFYHRFTNKYFDWHFGYLPKVMRNGEPCRRPGRMVWFTEDIIHN